MMEGDTVGTFGYLVTDVWSTESKIQKELFEEDGAMYPMNLTYIDVPHLYQHSEIGYKFIDALHKCKKLDLFALGSV